MKMLAYTIKFREKRKGTATISDGNWQDTSAVIAVDGDVWEAINSLKGEKSATHEIFVNCVNFLTEIDIIANQCETRKDRADQESQNTTGQSTTVS